MTKNRIPKYCGTCGEKLDRPQSGKFDIYTGDYVTYLICPNWGTKQKGIDSIGLIKWLFIRYRSGSWALNRHDKY